MSEVTATCARGHKWNATKIAQIRATFKGSTVIRIVDPKTCPVCKGEWIATYEKNDRRAS